MTTYYKGNNIGLNYDATTATWSFTNEPNDFIDTSAFSTKDPKFEYVPPKSEDKKDDDFNPCPPGYIYNSSLKQCVPDPNYQNPFAQGNRGAGQPDQPPVRIAGTNRYTTSHNFIATDEEYENMSAEELVENYKQRGMVDKNKDGNLVIDLSKMQRSGAILDALFSRVPGANTNEAEATVRKSLKHLFDKNIVHSDLNPDAFNFYVPAGQYLTSETMPLTKLFEKDKENYKIILPTKQAKDNTVVGTTGTEVVGGWGSKIFDTSHGVYGRGEDIIPDNPFTETLNKWANYANLTTNASSIFQNRLDKESALKDEQIKQAQIKTERERNKLANELDDMIKAKDDERKEKNKKDMQQTIKDAEKEKKLRDDLSQDISSQVPSSTFTGGSTSGSNSGSTSGSTSGGTSLGSSLHGTGSYNQPKSKPKSKPRPTHHF